MVETVQERMKRIEEQKKYIKEHEGLSKIAFLTNKILLKMRNI